MNPYELPKLSYDFGALEPVISAEIMEIHYTKHHATYVNQLKVALEKHHEAEKKGDLPAMIALQGAIRFNGGGHINHTLFWENLSPKQKSGGIPPKGALLKSIEQEMGSFEVCVERLSQAAMGVQGSGWAWLGVDKLKKKLIIATCANQDPLATQGLEPLLGIDVWEHAYYLQYKNVRAEYVKNVFTVLDWSRAESRFAACFQ